MNARELVDREGPTHDPAPAKVGSYAGDLGTRQSSVNCNNAQVINKWRSPNVFK